MVTSKLNRKYIFKELSPRKFLLAQFVPILSRLKYTEKVSNETSVILLSFTLAAPNVMQVCANVVLWFAKDKAFIYPISKNTIKS